MFLLEDRIDLSICVAYLEKVIWEFYSNSGINIKIQFY